VAKVYILIETVFSKNKAAMSKVKLLKGVKSVNSVTGSASVSDSVFSACGSGFWLSAPF
jgi:hypothetical protein